MRKKRTIIDESLDDDKQTAVEGTVTDFVCMLSKVYKLNAGVKSFCFQSETPVDEVYIQSQYPSGGRFLVLEYNALNEQLDAKHIDIEPKPLTGIAAGNGVNPDNIRTSMLIEELNFSRQMMLQLIQGLMNNKTTNQPTMTDMIAAMQGIHAMSPGKDSIEFLMKGMDLGMRANGGNGGDWKTAAIESVKEIGPQVLQMLNKPAQPQPTNGQTQMLPAQQPAQMIQYAITWIKQRIITGQMDPGLAVAWLSQNATDPQYQPLLAAAIQGDINTFISIDAELGNEPYRTWFTEAIRQLKEWYIEQTQSDDSSDMARGDGDSPNPAIDAQPSPRKSNIKKAV